MRRRLINWETFDTIQKGSLSTAEHELFEATDVLEKTLGIDHLELDCFGESNVVYATIDGTYVRADYTLREDYLTLENIEELVIDNESAEEASKARIANMVEAILNNESHKAKDIFNEYIQLPSVRRTLSEGREGGFIRPSAEKKKAATSKTKNAKRFKSKFARRKEKLDAVGNPNAKPRKKRGSIGSTKDPDYMKKYYKNQVLNKTKRKVLDKDGKVSIKMNMNEPSNLSENVMGYCSYIEYGPVIKESSIRKDEKGQIVALKIPTSKVRNEGKILSFNWKTLNTEVKVIRETAMRLANDMSFCKAIAELKKHNNLADSDALQITLESIIGNFPSVLYLTQNELASIIGEALNISGVSNYDDNTCAFMAEGILRTAHDAFSERVERIWKLSQEQPKTESQDAYTDFQDVVSRFYPSLDENYKIELKVFSDLFEAVKEVYELAENIGNEALRDDASDYLDELASVVNGESRGDVGLAADVAGWLDYVVQETNLAGGEWNVSNTPHETINGDHPAMNEKARKSYSPAQDMGASAADWQSKATEKAFTGERWTSVGGDDVFPDLRNPYIPNPLGDYTMKGEKGVDKDWQNASGTWQSDKTVPNLQNPNVPKAETPKTYKMKSDNLVVDL